MNTERKYCDEVLADAMAGVVPNLSVAQRAIAQVDHLRALNAELLGACQSALRALLDNTQPGPMDEDAIAGLRAAIAKATQS